VNIASLTITPDLLRLVAEIDEFKGSWRALKTLAPERLAALRRVATIESIGSSTRIEGARLSDRAVEELLGRIDRLAFESRDEAAVAGYADAMDLVLAGHTDLSLSENHIKQLHAVLLRHSTRDERHRGAYKTLPNNVEAFDAGGKSLGVLHRTATPFDTPGLMTAAVAWTRETLADNSLHPLLAIGMFVVTFLDIHPFQDGNGRLSRILTTLLLLRAGYAHVPFGSLESVIEAGKEDYYLALRRTQATLRGDAPDWPPWLRFFLDSLKTQKDRLGARLEGVERATGLPAWAVPILDHVQAHGRITTGEAVRLTGAPLPTVKNRLGILVREGLVVRHGRGRGSWYQAQHLT